METLLLAHSRSWPLVNTPQLNCQLKCSAISSQHPLQNSTELTQSQSQIYVTTDGRSASLSWNKIPIWGLRPDLYYCQTTAGLLMWDALSEESTGRLLESQSAVISLFSVAHNQSQGHIATDGQSITKSWCRAPSGAHKIFIILRHLRTCFSGTTSLTRGRVCLWICCWPSTAQSFSGPSPLRLETIFYSLRFETSLFAASYDSQGYDGRIRPHSTLVFQLHKSKSKSKSHCDWRSVSLGVEPHLGFMTRYLLRFHIHDVVLFQMLYFH
jgi:hypothetical protein